jgi:hypothetical protein
MREIGEETWTFFRLATDATTKGTPWYSMLIAKPVGARVTLVI